MIEIAYLIGVLFFFRYYVGFILHALDIYSPDWFDLGMAFLMTSLVVWTWPVVVPLRFCYRGYMYYLGDKDLNLTERFFPEPKEIITKSERMKEKERMAREELRKRQAYVNEKELEFGIEPTVW